MLKFPNTVEGTHRIPLYNFGDDITNSVTHELHEGHCRYRYDHAYVFIFYTFLRIVRKELGNEL